MKRCPNCGLQYPDDANFCPVDAGRLGVPTNPGAGVAQVGTGVSGGLLGGRFQVGGAIGGRRTGPVHEAADTSTGLPCVVKRVSSGVFPTPLLKQRTERELRQLERVRAASVAHVLAHGKEGEEMWVALERVSGRALSEIVAEQGPMPADRAKRVVLAIGDALSEAAKVGVIHRDVSPKNVLLQSGDSVKVINFGVPVPVSPKLQGEPEFVSPEQIEGKPVDQRSNIYSLGALFYYLVTGVPPFAGDDVDAVAAQHLSGHVVPPSQLAAVAPAVEAVIMKALERQSSKRFMTLRQMLGDVERADTSGAVAPPPRPAAAPAAPAARYPAMAAALPAAMASAIPAPVIEPEAPPLGKPVRRSAAVTMIGGFTAIESPPGAPPPGQPMPSPPPVALAPFAPAQPTLMAAAPAQVPTQLRGPEPMQPPMQPQPAPMPYAPQPQAMPYAPQQPYQPQPPMPYAQTPYAGTPAPAPPQQPTMMAAAPAPVAAPAPPPQQQASTLIVGAGESAAVPAGKRPRAQEPAARTAKSKFRETMWFKKGELDAVAAEEAAVRVQAGDVGAPDKVDELPMEDRYKDDGTLTAGDQERLSLRTGSTQMMQALRAPAAAAAPSQQMAEDELIQEMKGGRGLAFALVIAGLIIVGGLVAFFIFK